MYAIKKQINAQDKGIYLKVKTELGNEVVAIFKTKAEASGILSWHKENSENMEYFKVVKVEVVEGQ